MATASKASSSRTALARPIAAASSAENSAANVSSSKLFFSPRLRLRMAATIAGTNPIFTSGNPNLADLAATTRSHAIASPHPPASARPCTAATTGTRTSRINSNNSASHNSEPLNLTKQHESKTESLVRGFSCDFVVPFLIHLRGPVDLGGKVLDRARYDTDLLRCFGPVSLLDRLPNSWQRLHAVPRVITRRIDLMSKPVASRQPFASC